MGINELIAQGAQPIGRDIPNVLNALERRKQQQFQNAMMMRNQGLAEQEAAAGQQEKRTTEEAKQAYAEASYIDNIPDEQLIPFVQQNLPHVSQAMQRAGISDVAGLRNLARGVKAKAGSMLGIQQAQAPVPFEQSEAYLMEQFKAGNARRLEMLKQRGDSAPKPAKQEVITRPVENGMLQDFAYDPANPSVRAPVGAPYKQGSSKADEADAGRSQALALYETARDGLIAGLEGTSTGPIAGRIPAFTAGQQTAEGGVAAMAPVLKQLFRVSGEGVFTDKDQQLLLDMVPKRTDLPESRKAKIENIDKIVKAKLGIGQSAGGKKVISFGSLGK